MTKNEIRKLVKQKIQNLSSEQKAEYSASICKKIIESKEFVESVSETQISEENNQNQIDSK